MPLFLRSLPLSIMTFWHYIFVLPVVVVMSIPFVFLSLIPIVGIVFSTGLTAFITIISFRCALTAYGAGNAPDIVKLVKSSLALGFMNMFAGLMILIVAVAFAIALSWLGVGESSDLPGADVIPMVPASAFLLYLLLVMCFNGAMAVPTAALAQAATEHSRDPGVIFGFGGGFFNVMAAWFIWLGGLVFLGFYGIIAEAITTGLQLMLGNFLKIPESEVQPIRIVPLVIAVVYMLWGPCWYSATAVLAWDRIVKRRDIERVKMADVSRVSAEELQALRQSRMPGTGQH